MDIPIYQSKRHLKAVKTDLPLQSQTIWDRSLTYGQIIQKGHRMKNQKKVHIAIINTSMKQTREKM